MSYEEQQIKVNGICSLEVKRLKACCGYLRLLLDQDNAQQVDFQHLGSGLELDRLAIYAANYDVPHSLLDMIRLYKMRIVSCLGKAVPYK